MNCKNLEKILEELRKKYQNVYFENESSDEDDFYSVNVSDATVAHSNEFKEFIGKKICEASQRGEKFNAFFCYDSQFEEKMKNINYISSMFLPELNVYMKNTNYQSFENKIILKKGFMTSSEANSNNFFKLKNKDFKNTNYQFCQNDNLVKDSISINQSILAA